MAKGRVYVSASLDFGKLLALQLLQEAEQPL